MFFVFVYLLTMKHLTVILCLFCSVGFAQNYSVSGVVADSVDRSPLIGVSVWLLNAADTTQRKGAVTDIDGRFNFTTVSSGSYVLRVSYIGYSTQRRAVIIKDSDVELKAINLTQGATTLKGVEVKGAAIRVEQKGDTLQYNANAFKTSRDANVDDLIAKMPGMTNDGTGLKAQGEAVQQVLVDGKEFFGDDATLALKNLPAEVVDKIEVFDRLSDQSQFTGFDDGQTRKTVNIVTKKGKNNGQFGRVYAGIGENGRYSAGGNINSFNGSRRLSVVGLTNNTNQQNFSNEDLLGVMSSSSSSAAGGGGARGGRGGGGGGRTQGAQNNFSVGQQNGISTTHSLGLNYVDEWGKKIKVNGSYFFNSTTNKRLTDLNRLYITTLDSGLVYRETSEANSDNYNHRFTFRFDYAIDSVNSLIVTPRLSFQQNNANSFLNGNYKGSESELAQQLQNQNGSDNAGYNFSNNIMLRHRFSKRGRSLSLGFTTEINDSDGTNSLYSLNDDIEIGKSITTDQQSKSFTDTYTLSPSLVYTEPTGKSGQMQVNYSPSYRRSLTDKKTYNFDTGDDAYTKLDTALSNTFNNTYTVQRGGINYRFNNKKLNFNTGINYQESRLQSDQSFPYTLMVDRSFSNLLPQFSLNYKFTSSQNIRVQYRTNANAPSISQLQNVVDNRNPLFLKTGNPDLSQDYSHNLMVRYSSANVENSSSFLVMANAGFTQNYISNTSVIALNDTTVNGVALTRGTQLSFPVNLNGYQSARGLLTYGIPVKAVKSNLNLTTSFNYNRVPALINGATNLAKNYSLSEGLVISSNINEKLDFTIGYTANYTIVKNTLQKQSNNNYLNQTITGQLSWIFWKGFVFTSNLNTTIYKGLSAQFDQSIWYWNAGLGYKFLKDQSLEIKVNAFDLLNQNNSIAREVTETYIEDRESNVLTRYFLLTATYRIGNFKSK